MTTTAEALAILDFIMDDTDADDVWHNLETSDSSSSSDGDDQDDEPQEQPPAEPSVSNSDNPLDVDFLQTIKAYSDDEFFTNFRVKRSTANVLIGKMNQSLQTLNC